MLCVLLIPHSNDFCKSMFNIVNQNLTNYRNNLGHETLEAMLIDKCVDKVGGSACYKTIFTKEILLKAKNSTYFALK